MAGISILQSKIRPRHAGHFLNAIILTGSACLHKLKLAKRICNLFAQRPVINKRSALVLWSQRGLHPSPCHKGTEKWQLY
jgi:hypothetical protein